MTDLNTLEKFGYRPLYHRANSTPIPESELGVVEPNRLPVDYAYFLNIYPSTGVFDRRVAFKCVECSPWASEGIETLEVLYGRCELPSNDLVSIRQDFLDQLPSRYLIIGEITGNAFVVLDTDAGTNGTVYVWDREAVPREGEGLYRVSDSFGGFLALLIDGEEPPSEQVPTLRSMNLSSDFRARAAEILAKKKKAE
jgi:hypothetical protein